MLHFKIKTGENVEKMEKMNDKNNLKKILEKLLFM